MFANWKSLSAEINSRITIDSMKGETRRNGEEVCEKNEDQEKEARKMRKLRSSTFPQRPVRKVAPGFRVSLN